MSDERRLPEGVLLPPPNPLSGEEGVTLVASDAPGRDASVTVSAEKAVGKGWTVGGAFDYAKSTGARWFGGLTWRPKKD